ncbi:hypothetical protein ACFU76_04575 [Streptomyces sp. NPDC057539]|uniref:hypothetical protein n=1 Tax=Streptomyces sp. NPDC057539 TaxID=3346159 RepID=UPI0036C3A48B
MSDNRPDEPNNKPTEAERRAELIRTYSDSARRAHDKGNNAAAGALTDTVLKLIADQEKR